MRWRISYSPHAAGTDRGNPRDAGELYACQVFPLLFSRTPKKSLPQKRQALFHSIFPNFSNTVRVRNCRSRQGTEKPIRNK